MRTKLHRLKAWSVGEIKAKLERIVYLLFALTLILLVEANVDSQNTILLSLSRNIPYISSSLGEVQSKQ